MFTALQVHDKEYLQQFNEGTLDTERMRRIGFVEVTRDPLLVARTKAEVAGTFPCLQHLQQICMAVQHLYLLKPLAVGTAGRETSTYRKVEEPMWCYVMC
jgi:hypothetical protein